MYAAAAAIAPQDTTAAVATPSWASNLWASSGGMPQTMHHHHPYQHAMNNGSGAAQPFSFASRRAARHTSMSRSNSAAFMSTSAPAAGIAAPLAIQAIHTRQYSSGGILGSSSSSSRHGESQSPVGEDRDATVRRKKAAAFHELRENSVSSGSADEQLQLDSGLAVPSSSRTSLSFLFFDLFPPYYHTSYSISIPIYHCFHSTLFFALSNIYCYPNSVLLTSPVPSSIFMMMIH
jgi:hypothetical protein